MRWHRRHGTEHLFTFFTRKLFLISIVALFCSKFFIIGFVGVGPGDVAYHPLNLTGTIICVYLCFVSALSFVGLRKNKRFGKLSWGLWTLGVIYIIYIYVTLFMAIFGRLKIELTYLILTYISFAFMTWIMFTSIYLAKPKLWDAKAFKLQDIIVLTIAFIAFSGKLLRTQDLNVSNLENIWLLLATGAFAAQLAKLTFQYARSDP